MKYKKLSKKNITLLLSLVTALLLLFTEHSQEEPIPTVEPTPSTAVVLSSSTTSAALKTSGVFAKVERVVDGDTIKLETGETVRYIGIDTPETVDTKRTVMCYGKEASEINRQLVEGKTVELEKDVSETDRYGRLLRYVWLDGVLINEYLVREGYAVSSSYPPDIKNQSIFLQAEELARNEKKGLWSNLCATRSSNK